MTNPQVETDRINPEFDGRDPKSVFLTIAILRKRINVLESDLEECREFLADQCDVVDGDYGEPAPNRAMSLSTSIGITLYGPGNF